MLFAPLNMPVDDWIKTSRFGKSSHRTDSDLNVIVYGSKYCLWVSLLIGTQEIVKTSQNYAYNTLKVPEKYGF